MSEKFNKIIFSYIIPEQALTFFNKTTIKYTSSMFIIMLNMLNVNINRCYTYFISGCFF